jgi:transposase
MKFIDLMEFIQDENRSEEFLRSRGVLKTFTCCSNCGGDKLGMIRGDRWKCYSCKSEWTRRKDSILSLVRMKYSEFILCMKFFELELTAQETAAQLKLNYKTIVLLYDEFRKCISNISSLTIKEFTKTMKANVGSISIVVEGESVCIKFNTAELNSNNPNIYIRRSRVGKSSSIYEFKFSKLRKNLNVIGNKNFSSLGIFWRFAKPRLLNFKGTDLKTLLLYLKEIEYRFNHSKVDVFDFLGIAISKNFKRVVN